MASFSPHSAKPRRSGCLQRTMTVARFLPLGFILSMLLFAYLVLVDVHIRYGMLRRGRYISSAINLVVVTGLEALTLWALLVAVFKSPGHPAAGFEGEGQAFRGVEVGEEEEERGHGLGGKTQRHESRWMKRERKREARGLPSSSDDDEAGGEEADEERYEDEEGEGANADEAPLLSSAAQRGSRGGPASFRYNHANTSVFGVDGGLSALIPGKPQAPSRTGRAQLDDVMHAVEEGHDQARVGGDDVEEGSQLAYLGGLQVKNTGTRRWCKQCNVEKPDRAHHCSSCGVCVLRMDHHCPWLANRCVGLRNHKAFFLFLCYTALLCVFAFQDMARTIVHYVNEETNGFETSPVTWAILLFIGFIFGMALFPFAGYHLYLILRNRTTLESMEGAGRVRVQAPPPSPHSADREDVSVRLRRLAGGDAGEPGEPGGETAEAAEAAAAARVEAWRRDEQLTREERRVLKKAGKLNIYDVGWRGNWHYLMGKDWKLWFVPIGEPESDGYSYLVNRPTLRELEKVTREIRQQQGQRAAGLSAVAGLQQSIGLGRRPPAVSSVRGQARVSSSSSSSMDPSSKAANKNQDRRESSTSKSAHGVIEWGERPKKDFLLYGVESDEDEYGNDR